MLIVNCNRPLKRDSGTNCKKHERTYLNLSKLVTAATLYFANDLKHLAEYKI